MSESQDDKSLRPNTPASGDEPTSALDAHLSAQIPAASDESQASLAALGQRYDILAELGRGGMGIVYKARDRETNETVALKVLRPEIASRPDILERFKSELRLARKITHKSVCRTHELLRFNSTVAIAMEYVAGESLRQILSRFGGVPLRRGMDWAAQICGALAEAHAQGVIHRDLKPENIVIDKQGVAKVMDFGIARSMESEAAATRTIIGTPAYMSPEQAEGKAADARSDIYSLGLILYEMFTGHRTFHADTPAGFLHKQVHETPTPPREVERLLPPFMDRAIWKCLEKNPKKRFQSAAELEAALAEKAEAKPRPGEEVELPEHLTRWQRSDWWLIAAAIVGLALFFPFFNRTSLAPRSKVSFDHSILRRIGEEFARRVGAPIGQVPRTGLLMWPVHQAQYDYVAETAGARAALELTSNPVPYWVWQVEWENGTSVSVDNRGLLQMFSRNFPAGAAPEKLSVEEARPRAEKALREFFERNPDSLHLESAVSDIYQGHPATSFTWLDPQSFYGLRRWYVVRLVGPEIGSLGSGYNWPADYFPPAGGSDWPLVVVLALGLVLMIFGLLRRQHVDLRARWRIGTSALLFAVGTWWGWTVFGGLNLPLHISITSLLGGAYALMGFFVLIALERLIRKTVPAKLLAFTRLLDRSMVSEPCGLAVVRGTLVGLALLGIETFLVWAGTSYLRMRLASEAHIFWTGLSLGKDWSSMHATLNALEQTVVISVVLILAGSVITRFGRRAWVAACLVAGLGVVAVNGGVFGAVAPFHWHVLFVLLDSLVLVWTFARFDVLTLVVAVFTFSFCWQNYPLLIMLQPTGAAQEWAAFALWGLFVLAAAVVAFKIPLRGIYRRAAAVFE